MFHAVTWVRKPYYKFDNLKQINIDNDNGLLKITLFINERKEYTYNLEAEVIKNIKFCVGYNKSLDKAVFFVITYIKENKEYMISFYLPRKYEHILIEDMRSFAQNRGITFTESKSLNPIFFIVIGFAIFYFIGFLIR